CLCCHQPQAPPWTSCAASCHYAVRRTSAAPSTSSISKAGALTPPTAAVAHSSFVRPTKERITQSSCEQRAAGRGAERTTPQTPVVKASAPSPRDDPKVTAGHDRATDCKARAAISRPTEMSVEKRNRRGNLGVLSPDIGAVPRNSTAPWDRRPSRMISTPG
ncbi:hypothetical protein B0H16DRAFT_1491878, partial [Mycena metata]